MSIASYQPGSEARNRSVPSLPLTASVTHISFIFNIAVAISLFMALSSQRSTRFPASDVYDTPSSVTWISFSTRSKSSSMVNSLPLPSSLFSDMLPPIMSTSRFAMVSPRPEPSIPAVFSVLSCEKGSNSLV